MNIMNSPEDWLLVVELDTGERACINLWKAIEDRMLTMKVNPINRAKVVDICADTPEFREDWLQLDKPGATSTEPDK